MLLTSEDLGDQVHEWTNSDRESYPCRSRNFRGDLPLLPARMVNEYEYCPRLAYLEWVQGEWADSADTVEGRHAHRRVDKPGGSLPAPDAIKVDEHIHARSITLSSNRLGLIAKLDLIEADGGNLTPVDYKRGKRPHIAQGAYDPERVQLCVQALLLEENGYTCEEGILYFSASKERVRVVFDGGVAAEDPRRDRRPAFHRRRWPDAIAAAGQPQVPALLAGRDLPSG